MTRLLALAALLAPLHVAAAAEVTQSVTTTASPKAVWAVIGAFDGIHTWLPGVLSSPADHGNAIGSVRVLTLSAPGNPTIHEQLTARKGTSYTYKIVKVDPKVLPVNNYVSTISVVKAGSGATLTWQSTFQPATGTEAAAGEKALTGLYQAGLGNIKKLAEK